MTISDIAALVAPWQTLYSDSTFVSAAVLATHLLGMLIAGGLALGADRATLRALARGGDALTAQLAELSDIHRPVLTGLAAVFISGALLGASDVETFLPSPFYWTKLGLVAALMVNGAVLAKTEQALRAEGADAIPLRARLALVSRLSIALWCATALAGVVLAEFA